MLTKVCSLNADNTILQAAYEASWDEELGDYTASITLESGQELYDQAINGDFGDIQPYDQENDSSYVDPIEEMRSKLKCSRLQAKAILHQYNMLDDVDAMIAEADFLVQLAWKEAAVFERNSIVIQAMKDQLHWPDGDPITDEDLDDMFVAAKQIEF